MQAANIKPVELSSKKDTWLVAVLVVTMAAEAVAAVALATAGPSSVWLRVVLPLLLMLSALTIAWCLFGTSYRVVAGELVIRSGPFRQRVPVAAITSVAATHTATAALALSCDRLELRCAEPDRRVLVSPESPADFIAALRAVKSTIAVSGERPTRAATRVSS